MVLLGEITISKSLNSNNLYKINSRLSANLYSSDDLALIKNINAIYSNNEIGLKYLQFLDNAKITYNPDDLIPKVLKEYIHKSSYIIINEIIV